ncbi:PLP-dependent aminotransferase family protein [Cupriavidus taiwanensis]|uniref:Putative transcriptional regulator, GntR family n=1 Tax=Cupriavidus taiwanensis TaxID=164546 RepID=A0A7Z7JFD2_9BURK|nr:PLP-dependent aminotransferase family protein [Cupriavidus taiwanensis]SOZ17183.1 putative transcriptional regulator, GntR family [Cupriavidus taiwanensis]SOZ96505.1 putative transcriptional regulator, GntR family [Cupriavidus taiwanensis]SPC25566.1 putative transcriptional regulator, GntR family [Cupriavidus taiwanensis]
MTYPFVPAFADPKGSPIRELFKYVSRPGMISFAGGSPASSLFDVEGLERAARTAFQDSTACLQYGATGGAASLRSEVIKLMERRGVAASDGELLVTTGSQQAFDLLLRVLVAPGDTVLLDEPAYPATLQALKLQGAKIVSVPSDSNGLDVDALDNMLSVGAIQPRPKLLYTVPSFANPTGATLSRDRRIRLLELVQRHDLLLVEDDPYSELRFTGEPIPSLLALSGSVEGSRERIIHLSCLSKIVAPGLRVGWSIAPDEITRRCNIAKQTADLCSPPWTQEIAAAYLRNEKLDKHVEAISATYGEKCRAMCTALSAKLGEILDFSEPEGGLFVWARFRHGIDSGLVLEEAIKRNVIFVPGSAFYADAADCSTLRLSYATASIPEIEEGVSRLAAAVDQATSGRRKDVLVAGA